MKCIECDCCRKGWFRSKPSEYVCIGTKEPFIITNLSQECTEYLEQRSNAAMNDKVDYFVNDEGLYVRQFYLGGNVYKAVITKEMFVEVYNKWIKGENDES